MRTAALTMAIGACLASGGCTDDDVIVGPDGSASGDMAMTLPRVPLGRFAVLGDFGVDTMDELTVTRMIKSWRPDYIVTVGDNNYPNGEEMTIDANVGQYFAPYIAHYQGKYGPGGTTNRFWPCLGNHDWYSQSGAQPYLDYFPALPGNRRYYDYAIGNIHFFALDSEVQEPDGIDATSVQAAWLQAGLAASKECFNIVYFHHPPYSSGDPTFVEPRMRWPFAAWGVDLVLDGHEHVYERIELGGMTYVTDGLGGALNRFPFGPVPVLGSLVRYNADFGALYAEVYDGMIEFTFRNTHGDVIDRFDIQRDCSTPHMMSDAGL